MQKVSKNKISRNESTSNPKSKLPRGVKALTPKPIRGISEYELVSNGLKILLVENHAQPVVAVNTVYHVGSRNEAVGFTGATHFLEHMMFKGTAKFDPLNKTGIDDLLKRVGGMNNATTWFDRTNYFEVVPAKHVEICLDIEADRMRNLLLRQSDRNAEMTVVRNELERGEDSPDELLDTMLFATAFREHPYHHPTIGWRTDVEGVPTSRLKKFYDDFYWPSNATIMVLGDFDSTSVLKLIASKFSKISRNPNPYPDVYTVEPPQEGERRFVVKRGVDVPRLVIGYHVPKCISEDTYALDVLTHILGDGSKKSSRLYTSLIASNMASNVDASNYSLKDPGLFVLSAQKAGKSKLEELEKLLLTELEKLAKKEVSDKELNKAKSSITKTVRLSTADPLGFSMYLTEAIASANWRWWLEYPSKVEKVTKADILKVARKYFGEDNRTVGYYYPRPVDPKAESTKALAKKSTESKKEVATTGGIEKKNKNSSSLKVQANPYQNKKVEPVSIRIADKVKRTSLKNGMTILTLSIPNSTTVAVSGKIFAGDNAYQGKKSQVPIFVSSLLTSGSSDYSKSKLADELELMGCDLDFDPDTFFQSFDSHIVKEDLPRYLKVVSNVMMKPTFPKKELALELNLRKSQLKESMADTDDMCWNKMLEELYKPESSFYQKSFKAQLEELKSIKVKDLKDFHKEFFCGKNTIICFVGAVSHDEVVKLCKKNFQDWKAGKRVALLPETSSIKELKSTNLSKINIPDKSNVDIRIAKHAPVKFGSKDYFATVLANAALGYDSFSCRLGPVRDKYGLTYGIYSVIGDPTITYGPWYIKYSVNPKNIDKAQKIVKDIVAKYLKEGITQKELDTEKSHLSGIFSVHLRSPKKIAYRLSFYEACGVPLSYIDNYSTNIYKVQKSDVDKAIRNCFDISKNSVTVMSGTLTPPKPEKLKSSK